MYTSFLAGFPSLLLVLGLVILLLVVRKNKVEEAKLVDTSRRSDNTKPVTEVVLLEELLGQVLDILARELGVGDNGDLVAVARHLNGVAEVASAALDLDALDKELLKGSDIDDVVLLVGSGVNDELLLACAYDVSCIKMLSYCVVVAVRTEKQNQLALAQSQQRNPK
jgi:ribosomal RNA-processing protein 12